MLVRRAVYFLQFPLAILLPIWVLIARGIFLDGFGWQFVVYLFVCPILFVAMLIVSGIIAARKSARESRAVSWLDTLILVPLWFSLIASGLWAVQGVAVLVILLLIAGFWIALWELITDTRRQLNEFTVGFERQFQQPEQLPQPPGDAGPIWVVPPPIEDK